MTNISQWSCPTEIEIENTENSIIRNENDKLSDDSNFLRCQNFEKISNDQQYGKFEKNDQLNYQDKDKIYFKTNSTKSNIDMNSGIHSRHYNKNDEYHHDNNDNKNNRNDNDNHISNSIMLFILILHVFNLFLYPHNPMIPSCLPLFSFYCMFCTFVRYCQAM